MLFVDAVIYAIIAWYMEHVKPGPYGQARPFYFPFLVRKELVTHYTLLFHTFFKKMNIFSPAFFLVRRPRRFPLRGPWRGGGRGGEEGREGLGGRAGGDTRGAVPEPQKDIQARHI